MVTLQRTTSENKDFQQLVVQLDAELAQRNGDTDDFFAQFNGIAQLDHVVVAYTDGACVGCGAIKPYNESTMEVKRMYVPTTMRGKGVAVAVLHELENWAKELGYSSCILETGLKMPEAIGLYRKSGYRPIPNYGQYEHVQSSVCFQKHL